MDLFDEIFDHNGDGKLDSWERLDRDITNNIIYQNARKRSASSTSPSSYRDSPQGCYIATCVYGSYDCEPVWTLRRFRDDILANTATGRLFIRIYYAISPWLVKKFGDRKTFRAVWRKTLDSLVTYLMAKGISSAPYTDQ